MSKEALAYFDDDNELQVATVSETKEAVMVNVIVIASYRHIVPGPGWTFDMIQDVYLNVTGGQGDIKRIKLLEIKDGLE